ncbi:MAG: methyltransferase domain-containing protein, partial [bacterium]
MKYPVYFLLIILVSPLYPAEKNYDSAQSHDIQSLARSLAAFYNNHSGLIVHLGSGNGRLTSALSDNGKFLVQGLEMDKRLVSESQKHIQSQGRYGYVSIEQCSFNKLPYADNLINIIIIDDIIRLAKYELPIQEIMRVLCPNGILYIGQSSLITKMVIEQTRIETTIKALGINDYSLINKNGIWARIIKPRPADMDEWTHWLYNSGHTRVSKDGISGPPSSLRWLAGPVSNGLRAEMGSVCANGRIFNVTANDAFNLFIPEKKRPSRLYLIARDAYNGTRLWRRKFNGNAKNLIASGDTLFCIIDQSVCAVDAESGETLAEYGK